MTIGLSVLADQFKFALDYFDIGHNVSKFIQFFDII
jgi:hypothetical protein